MTSQEIPRYKLAQQVLEVYLQTNIDIAAEIETLAEGNDKQKLIHELSVRTENAIKFRQHYGSRSERTKDPVIRDVEAIIGTHFEIEEGEDEDEDEDDNQ